MFRVIKLEFSHSSFFGNKIRTDLVESTAVLCYDCSLLLFSSFIFRFLIFRGKWKESFHIGFSFNQFDIFIKNFTPCSKLLFVGNYTRSVVMDYLQLFLFYVFRTKWNLVTLTIFRYARSSVDVKCLVYSSSCIWRQRHGSSCFRPLPCLRSKSRKW